MRDPVTGSAPPSLPGGQGAGAASLRQLLEALDHLVFALDGQGRITEILGHWLVREGIDPTSLLGRNAAELMGGEAGALHAAAHARALAGEHVSLDWWLPSPEGARHFEAELAPLAGPGGQVTGVAGVARETTSQRHQDAERLLSERAAPVGTFATGMAHQINNPLATVMANLDYVLRELDELDRWTGAVGGPAARVHELVEPLRDARDAAERIRGLVRDLQRFASFGPERRGPVDVRQSLNAVLSLLWKEIQPRARLVKDLAPVTLVRASESRLRELFLHLIRNAVQALPEGDAEHNHIRVTTTMDGTVWVAVTVEDSGEGIPPENRARIFDPFFTTRPVGAGTGLGLTVCRRIVDELGGRIEVASEVGGGAVFRVSLPALQAAPEVDSSGTPREALIRRGRVLVVDDEPALGRAVRRCLMADHEVTVVPSAPEAQALLQAGGRYDVIVCDLIMPGMTGMDLHAELLRTDQALAARMVFLTGGASVPEARDFLERVPNPRVEKPFEAKNLAAIVARLVR